MTKYTYGQIVFIVASDCLVQEVKVEEINGQNYTLSFEQGGRITMPEDRIYSSLKSAESRLEKVREKRKGILTYTDKIKARIL